MTHFASAAPHHSPNGKGCCGVMCGRRLAVKHYVWHGDDCGRGSHVSGLLVQPLFTTAGPDVVREAGPDQGHGLDTRDPKKVFPPRRPTDQHHAISTSATRDALRRVRLALALQSCADAAAITPSPSLLSGSRAHLRSILRGAMASLVDAAVDHDGPGDPRGLIGDRDRRLLGRHAAEQLRHPGMLVRAFLRLAHDGHGAVNEK